MTGCNFVSNSILVGVALGILVSPASAGWDECKVHDFARAAELARTSRCVELEVKYADAGADEAAYADFTSALATNGHVRKLEMSSCGLDNARVDTLVKALISRRSDMYSIELTGNGQAFGDEAAAAVARFLAKSSAIRSLQLAGNGIADAGAQAIAAALPPQLRELDLSRNAIGNEGLQRLLDAAAATNLRELELDGNLVDDEGVDIIVSLLPATSVSELDLLDTNLTPEGVSRLLQFASDQRQAGGYLKIKVRTAQGNSGAGQVLPKRGHLPPDNTLKRRTANPALKWTERDVKEWLVKLHPSFKKYGNAMVDNAVDGKVLSSLTEEDLTDMGIDNKLHRKRIIAEAKALFADRFDELR